LSVLIAVGIVVALLVLTSRHGMYDLRIYRDSTRYWLDGRSLYAFERGPFRQGFTYPPFAALLLLPLALMPYPIAVFLSYALGTACLFGVMAAVGGPIFARRGWPLAPAVAWSAAFALALQPYRDTISFGQVNLALLAIVVADGYAIGRGSRWAGIGIGLATAVKLTPGIFIVLLLLAGRRRPAARALAALAGATLLAAVVAPATSWQFWSRSVFDTSRVGAYDSTLNQSLAGLVARLADPAPLPKAVWVLSSVAVGVFGLWRARRAAGADDLPVALALAGLTGSIVSPITWVHHLVWVGPAILHLVDAGFRRRQRRWYVTAGAFAALFAAAVPTHLAAPPGRHWSGSWPHQVGESAVLVGIVLLVAVLPWSKPGYPQDDQHSEHRGRTEVDVG